jgi:poly(3-hydroxyoctanoate) depolymerase
VRWAPFVVRASGLRMRVARTGSGPPLVLVTGIGANLDMWEPFVGLMPDRELVAFDPPGAGGSQRPSRPLRMSGLAGIVFSLLDELGLAAVDVLGYSFGGSLAQELARRAPQRVRRLILCATAPGLGGVPPWPYPAVLLASPARYYHPRAFRFEVPRIAGGRTRREPALLERQAAARLKHPPDPLGYAYQLYAISGWTSLPWLHRIRQPTLVLAGDEDPIVPVANARLMARRIPAARLRVVRGGGHLFLLDQPETVVEDIHAFLNAQD